MNFCRSELRSPVDFGSMNTQLKFLLTARLGRLRQLWFCGCSTQRRVIANRPRSRKGSPMSFSLLLRQRKQPATQCSICGWNVTLELSRTDERGKAVHEGCYVHRTLSKFGQQMEELPQSFEITPIDPERTVSDQVPSRMHWRIFGLVRL